MISAAWPSALPSHVTTFPNQANLVSLLSVNAVPAHLSTYLPVFSLPCTNSHKTLPFPVHPPCLPGMGPPTHHTQPPSLTLPLATATEASEAILPTLPRAPPLSFRHGASLATTRRTIE